MVGENEELKEELRLKTTSIEDLTRKCVKMAAELETVSRQEESLKLRIEEVQYQKNLLSMEFAKREETWGDFAEELLEGIEIKSKECEKLNEETAKMKNHINKFRLLLSDDGEKFDDCKVNEDFGTGLEDILKKVDVQVYKIVENEKMLRNEKQELCELVEFLENEEAIVIEDTEKIKEAANELKSEKNDLETINEDLENKVEFWTQCCGKLYYWTKSEGRMFEELEAKSIKVGKVAKCEIAKRKKSTQQNKCLVKLLKASQAKARFETEMKNILDAKNFDLHADLRSLREKLDSYDNKFKFGILESSKFDELIERNTELENELQFLDNCLKRNQKELHAVKTAWERMRVQLEEEIKSKVVLEEELNEISVKKNKFEIDVQNRDRAIYELQHEISKLEDRIEKSDRPKLSCFQKFVRCSLG